MEKREPSCTVGGNAATVENSMRFLKKLKTELSYDPALLLWNMSGKKQKY